MIKIEKAVVDSSSPVFDLVEKLLAELRDEGEDFSRLDRDRILAALNEAPQRFVAFMAYNENHQPIGIITLAEGFAFYAGGNFGIINELYITPDHRSQKVGQQLLNKVKEYGRRKGWQRIDVTAPPGDRWRRTVAFYEREGFTFTGPKLKFKLA
jgi:GNAT superfamily N-acetyltransferase